MPEEINLDRKRSLMYMIGFLFTLSAAIPAYYTSTFLSGFVSEKLVGIIYTASSILAIAAFIEMPGLLKRFGNFKATISLLSLQILSLIGLIWGTSIIAVIAAFMLNFVTISLTNFSFDVFLEQFSNNNKTGKIRGAYLTISNLAYLIVPTLLAYLLTKGGSQYVFLASALLIVPMIILVALNLGQTKDPIYSRAPFWKSFGEIWTDHDIKGVLIIQFLLQFFYAWMVIYTPIYLHEVVGFGWETIAIIFTVMLTPFVLLEAPLGLVADKFGEKKGLVAGFAIMGISTGLIAFVTDHNALIWASVLFMTRVGAATIEVMADTYFFKKVDASKTHIISFFRTARPIAYVVSPIVATLLFTAFDMKGLFIFLGLLMLYGIRYAVSIADTR